jgi:hypothetical protein
LRQVSLGQYRTPLYFEGSDSYSSALGGLATLILVILLFAYGFSKMLSIINLDNYYLDQRSREIQAYTVSEYFIYTGDVSCTDCNLITVKESFTMFFSKSYFKISFPHDEGPYINCSGLNLTLGLYFKRANPQAWVKIQEKKLD